MNCPICNKKVLNNTDYSVHMNLAHRGKTYKALIESSEKKKHESNGASKTRIYTKLD